MQIVSAEEFARRTARFNTRAPADAPIQLAGTPFECACGESHAFCPVEAEHMPQTPILASSSDWRLLDLLLSMLFVPLPGGRFIIGCPTSHAATCVRLEGALEPRIHADFGTTHLPDHED